MDARLRACSVGRLPARCFEQSRGLVGALEKATDRVSTASGPRRDSIQRGLLRGDKSSRPLHEGLSRVALLAPHIWNVTRETRHDMKISLIICTRNRAEQLRRCLASVERLTCRHAWELIIVDNGSSDGTAALVRAFRDRVKVDLKLVNEPTPGLGRARNAGIAQATGDILAFTDDDCYPEPDFLEQIVKVFEDPAISYMGGRILLYEATDAPFAIRTDTNRTTIPPSSFIPAGLIQGANMAVRRSLIETIGGFDPMLGAGTAFACEDVEFVTRASTAGFEGGYFPGPVVYHHHGRKPGEAFQSRNRTYDYARGAYYAKFILKSQTRILAAKHWWWRTTWQCRGVFLRELLGAGHYCLVRLTDWGALSHSLRPYRLTEALRRR